MSTRILVVDDEKEIMDHLAKVLRERGYEVVVRASGQAAIESVKMKAPDLVLLDLKMPGLDGIETLRRLRRIAPGITVIILTGFGTLATAREAMRLGATDYITKPFNLAFLLTVIRDAIKEKAQPGSLLLNITRRQMERNP